jgi:hypothetical protein
MGSGLYEFRKEVVIGSEQEEIAILVIDNLGKPPIRFT